MNSSAGVFEDMASSQTCKGKPQRKRQTCPSVDEDTKPVVKRGSIASYICALCNQSFTRKTTVKEPHFASCVKTNGNPNGVAWDDHPSCYSKFPDGTRGPSGTVPAGLNSRSEGKRVRRQTIQTVFTPISGLILSFAQKSTNISAPDNDRGENTSLKEEHTEAVQITEKVESSNFEDTEGSSSQTLGRSSPLDVASSPPCHLKDEISQSQLLQLDSSPPAHRPAHAVTAADCSATRWMLSGMVMNQIVNIVIAASRVKAGLSDKEASRIFRTWRNLVSWLHRSLNSSLLMLTDLAAS